jgi:hypothetical protein
VLTALGVAGGVSRLGALALLVIGVAALALSELIHRRRAVADVYGGARGAPYYRALMLVFGLFWVTVAVWRLIDPSGN